jgi:predicted permease
MSAEVRKMFMKKQIYYVLVNLLMWTCFFINALYRIYLHIYFNKPDQKIVKLIDNLQTLSVVSAIITGLLFSCVRLFEPYIFFLIKKEISSWFGILIEESEETTLAESDSLAAILV